VKASSTREIQEAYRSALKKDYWLVLEGWVSAEDIYDMFDPRLPRGPDLIRNMLFDDYSWEVAMRQAIKRKEA